MAENFIVQKSFGSKQEAYIFIAKIDVVIREGSCLDYALATSLLIKELVGVETRVVMFIGYDHAFPEVKINGTWYVLDTSYTTSQRPIKAEEYTEYLRRNYPNIYNSISGYIDKITGIDVSEEHGFYK